MITNKQFLNKLTSTWNELLSSCDSVSEDMTTLRTAIWFMEISDSNAEITPAIKNQSMHTLSECIEKFNDDIKRMQELVDMLSK
jgi:hypothetical protein